MSKRTLDADPYSCIDNAASSSSGSLLVILPARVCVLKEEEKGRRIRMIGGGDDWESRKRFEDLGAATTPRAGVPTAGTLGKAHDDYAAVIGRVRRDGMSYLPFDNDVCFCGHSAIGLTAVESRWFRSYMTPPDAPRRRILVLLPNLMELGSLSASKNLVFFWTGFVRLLEDVYECVHRRDSRDSNRTRGCRATTATTSRPRHEQILHLLSLLLALDCGPSTWRVQHRREDDGNDSSLKLCMGLAAINYVYCDFLSHLLSVYTNHRSCSETMVFLSTSVCILYLMCQDKCIEAFALKYRLQLRLHTALSLGNR